MPSAIRRSLARALFEGVAAQPPLAAIRSLLELDDDLTSRINQAALAYEGDVHPKHRLMRYHDFFVDRIQSGDRVLDVGCGYGAVAYSIATRTGAQVTGIDISAENIAKARALFQLPNLTFVEGDALTAIGSERFDVVVLSNVLEHLEPRVDFLGDLLRLLRPRRILVRVPAFDRDWRVPLRKELGLPYFSDVSHYTEYTLESFGEEMRQAGLRIDHLQVCWGEIWADVRAIQPATG